MDQNGLQFRAEVQVFANLRNVQRFDAHAIASQHEAPVGLTPECDPEHPAQARETFRVPLNERIQDGLSITVGTESIAPLFQFLPQFQVIVDFPVEDDNRVAILGDDGLIAARNVDNLQACRAQRHGLGFKDALLVRTAMLEGRYGILDTAGRCRTADVRKAGNATQIRSSHPSS